VYAVAGTAGPIALGSSEGGVGLDLDLNQSVHASYAWNLYGTIPGWGDASEGASGQVDQLVQPAPPVPALGSIGFVGLAALIVSMGGVGLGRQTDGKNKGGSGAACD
jgi:hypothetical protein